MTTTAFQALRDWMAQNGCTQGEFAGMVGLSQGHLSAILAGKRKMTLEQALRASVVTEVAVEKLCNDADAVRILKLYVIRNKRAA